MSNFLFSFNNVVPVFLIIFIGVFIKKKNLINDNFASVSSKLVFTVALPALIFKSISDTDFTNVFNIKLILFAVFSVIILFLILTIFSNIFISDTPTRGAFIQGVFRSNIAIIGMPLIYNIFGDSGFSKSAILLSFVMPLYNVLAVVTLTVNSPGKEKINYKSMIINILKNPLILAAITALPFSYFQIRLPVFAIKTIKYLSDIAIPLALFGIGHSFSFKNIKNNIKYSLIATIFKLIVVPVIISVIAYYFGFRSLDLAVLFLIFASPTAINSFIMASAMKSNSDLAADIVLLATFFSVFTIFIGIYILKALSLI